MTVKKNSITSAEAWRSASRAVRREHAELLTLPSGATVLAARPEPLEWILAGRLPQRLLGVALDNAATSPQGAEREINREEILELARFATELVKATILEPAIGDGPGQIQLEDIPVQDRAFIFEWACRAWSDGDSVTLPADREDGDRAVRSHDPQDSNVEDSSIPISGIEGFRQK